MRRFWVLAGALVCLFAWRGGQTVWATEEFPHPPPPLSEDYYPCAENCHNDMDTDRTPRELEDEHTDIQLHHAEQFRWCLDCHDADDRDMLHLQSGEKIGFDESYLLCGQCHGDKYRDWREGIHGKRTGSWSGRKQYLLCAHCHNPHNPTYVLTPDPKSFPSFYREKFGEKASQDKMVGWPLPPPKVPGTGTLGSHGSNGADEKSGH